MSLRLMNLRTKLKSHSFNNGSSPLSDASERLVMKSVTEGLGDFGPIIGRGGFGYVCKTTLHGTPVAAKFLHMGTANEQTKRKRMLMKEAELLEKKRHKHIVHLHGFSEEYGCMVTEYCENKYSLLHSMAGADTLAFRSLADALADSRRFQEVKNLSTRLLWLQEIAEAMVFLHFEAPETIHGDLKTSNVFLDGRDGIKIGDLGMARIADGFDDFHNFGKRSDHRSLLLLYLPPEVMNSKGPDRIRLSPESDVWSFAIIMQEVITMNKAFNLKRLNTVEALKATISISKYQLKPEIDDDRSKLPGEWHPCLEPLVQLMDRCCATNPKDRPNFKAIYAKIREIRQNYEKEIPLETQEPVEEKPECGKLKLSLAAVATIVTVFLLTSSLKYLISNSNRVQPFSVITYMVTLAVLISLFVTMLMHCNGWISQRRQRGECNDNDGEERVDLREFVNMLNATAAEDVARLQRAPNPFQNASIAFTDSPISSDSTETAFQYTTPENWSSFCDAMLMDIDQNTQCIYAQMVRSYCNNNRNLPAPNAEAWNMLLQNVLNSPVVMRTSTWQNYQNDHENHLEIRVETTGTDPSSSEATVPINLPAHRPFRTISQRDSTPGTSACTESTVFFSTSAEVPNTDDLLS